MAAMMAEVKAGTSKVVSEGGSALRVVDMVSLRLVSPDGEMVLVQVKPFESSSGRMQFNYAVPGTKLKPDEDPWDAVPRVLEKIEMPNLQESVEYL